MYAWGARRDNTALYLRGARSDPAWVILLPEDHRNIANELSEVAEITRSN